MRVVLGACEFAHPAGTESYVATVAHELRRLGHEPIVTAQELGPMAEVTEQRGIAVARDPSELPPTCDAVFAQDAIAAGTLAERYPDRSVPPPAPNSTSCPRSPMRTSSWPRAGLRWRA